ncbi:MAG TPA: AAA family ATPase [Chthoniobacteraceae bacterium]|nr:AAA family ATPase [Chthoniobacteraceae bacterium]
MRKKKRKALPRKSEALPVSGFIRALRLRRDEVADFGVYPFAIPAVKKLDRIKLHPAVTFFIGENGSGKSTLLEALAVRAGFNAEGGSRNFYFRTRESHSELFKHLVLEREPRHPADGFFLRAESFYNVATEIENLDAIPSPDRPIGPSYGATGLHDQSHGQAFFSMMMNRLRGNGLYIFDEPEAALSPQRQMSALTLIHDLVAAGSQFIIATHSPIILAYPDATIYEFGAAGIRTVAYEETDHFRITRGFLNRHRKMLDILLGQE